MIMTERIVKLYGVDESGEEETEYGAIIWDGEEFTKVIGPEGSDEFFERLFEQPVILKNGKEVTAEEDPEKWFKNLYGHYKSVGLRATAPRDLTEEDLAGYQVELGGD